MNRRREFLINSGLVLGTLAITPSLAFTTKKKAIGIQLWTMRETLPKDVKGVLKALEPVVNRLIVTKSDSPRALPVAELFAVAVQVFGNDRVFKEDDLNSAITYAMEQATLINQVSDGVSAVVITGSVVTAGSAREILRKIGRSEEK